MNNGSVTAKGGHLSCLRLSWNNSRGQSQDMMHIKQWNRWKLLIFFPGMKGDFKYHQTWCKSKIQKVWCKETKSWYCQTFKRDNVFEMACVYTIYWLQWYLLLTSYHLTYVRIVIWCTTQSWSYLSCGNYFELRSTLLCLFSVNENQKVSTFWWLNPTMMQWLDEEGL